MKEAFFFIRPTADTDASKLTLNKDEMWFEGYDQVFSAFCCRIPDPVF